MNFKGRELLLALSYMHQGEWKEMYEDIYQHRPLSQEEIDEAKRNITTPYVTILDEDYPEPLKQSYYPPFLLYYYGNLDLLKKKYRLTAIGTRTPTLYQSDTSYSLLKEVEEHFHNDLVILSGMAKGIDQSCMRAAMDQNAPAVSILGSGIDYPYPKENNGLYDYCKKEGLILSEYPLDSRPKPEHFVFRNRLLATLSMVVYCGGGKNRSGSMSTIQKAIEAGREICCLPCNVTGDDMTNSLLKDGASSILCASDLIEVLESRYGI